MFLDKCAKSFQHLAPITCSTAMAIDQAKDTVKVCSKSCVQSTPLPRNPVVGGGNGTSLRFFLHDFFYWETNPKLCQCWMSIVSDFFSVLKYCQISNEIKLQDALSYDHQLSDSIINQLSAWIITSLVLLQPFPTNAVIVCYLRPFCLLNLWALLSLWACLSLNMSMWFWEFESCYEPEISDLFFSGRPSQWESLS